MARHAETIIDKDQASQQRLEQQITAVFSIREQFNDTKHVTNYYGSLQASSELEIDR